MIYISMSLTRGRFVIENHVYDAATSNMHNTSSIQIYTPLRLAAALIFEIVNAFSS